ncbi:arylsulfotransferase family protein [Thermaurantiacus sp.]
MDTIANAIGHGVDVGRGMMDRPVPLWAVLLLALLGLVASVLFAGLAVNSMAGGERAIGKLALTIARSPWEARAMLRDVLIRARGRDVDWLLARQDPPVDLAGFDPLPVLDGVEIIPPLFRAEPARMERGWRIIVGVFQFPGGHSNGALLLTPDLRIVKVWKLTPEAEPDQEPTPVARRLVHEAEFLKDGSFIFVTSPSIGLVKRDSCGDLVWVVPGEYHHSVVADEEGQTVWATRDKQLTNIDNIDIASGRLLRSIPFIKIIEANPDSDIFQIRTVNTPYLDKYGTSDNRAQSVKWMYDPFHTNDVEPLPARLAQAFPQFVAGDLLVSNRELNLIFVLDPTTLKVKWWDFGNTDHQHDPDWLPDGRIMVYDNRARKGQFSRISIVDPRTGEVALAVDGRRMGFFSFARGKAEALPGGGFLVTSPYQGRVFETDANGDVVLDIVNPRDRDPGLMFMTTQTFFLPEDGLDWSQWKCKPSL